MDAGLPDRRWTPTEKVLTCLVSICIGAMFVNFAAGNWQGIVAAGWVGMGVVAVGTLTACTGLFAAVVLRLQMADAVFRGVVWAGWLFLFIYVPLQPYAFDVVKQYYTPVAQMLLAPFAGWDWPMRFAVAVACGFASAVLEDAWKARADFAAWRRRNGFPLLCVLALAGGLAAGWLGWGRGWPW